MSEYRGIFSEDGLYWWTGTAWMPTRPPDGRSATWTGNRWVARSGSLGTLALSGIALVLGFVELVWAIVAIVILVSAANAEYEASGRVGTEDIARTSISAPILLSLLIVPTIVTVLTSANVRRHWWVGVFLGGWPAILIALLALVSPGTGRLETIATVGGIVAVMIAIGWLVHLVAWRSWKLSADGLKWIRGRRSFPTGSVDGKWRWDGRTWQSSSDPKRRRAGSARGSPGSSRASGGRGEGDHAQAVSASSSGGASAAARYIQRQGGIVGYGTRLCKGLDKLGQAADALPEMLI